MPWDETMKLDWQPGRNRAQVTETVLGRLRVYLRTMRSGASIWTAELADGRRIATGHTADECKTDAEFHLNRLVRSTVT